MFPPIVKQSASNYFQVIDWTRVSLAIYPSGSAKSAKDSRITFEPASGLPCYHVSRIADTTELKRTSLNEFHTHTTSGARESVRNNQQRVARFAHF